MTNQGKNAVDTLLAESFKELTLKQPIEKITIKEITDKAGVIRPTFYNHFQDKYELLEWIKQIILGVIENKVTGKKPIHAWLTPDHLAEYYSQSMCFVAISWIKSNMVIPPKEVADIYQYVIKRSLDEILSEM